jgi:DNA-binding NtrC family response regulator
MDRKRILVVDDEQNMLLTVQFILQSAGYSVSTAHSGEEALESARSCCAAGEGFDLILTDIQMQGLTGLELIDSLRASGIQTPFLVMTGYGNVESVRELKRRGCAEFLEKPFDEEDLLRKVRQICGSGC